MKLDKIDKPVPIYKLGKGDVTMLEALKNQAKVNNICIRNLKDRIKQVEKDQESIRLHMEAILCKKQ